MPESRKRKKNLHTTKYPNRLELPGCAGSPIPVPSAQSTDFMMRNGQGNYAPSSRNDTRSHAPIDSIAQHNIASSQQIMRLNRNKSTHTFTTTTRDRDHFAIWRVRKRYVMMCGPPVRHVDA